MDALTMAVRRRGKADALPHRSDQGSQCTGERFLRLPLDCGITCSMSRAGDVWDNSAMESFFSSQKTERAARKVRHTRDAARADVFDDIERFCNPRRRHSKLGCLSPMAFEDRAMQPQPNVHGNGGKPLHLVAIMDRATRNALSWRLSDTMEADFRIEAREEALERFGAPGIFNTDQGGQFTSQRFTDVLKTQRCASAWTAGAAGRTTSSSRGCGVP